MKTSVKASVPINCGISLLLFYSCFLFLLAIFIQDNASAAVLRKGVSSSIFGYQIGSTLNFDFSKSFISGYINFQKERPTFVSLDDNLDIKNEFLFYLNQFKKSFTPKYFLIELDYCPLTSLGLYLYENRKNLYNDFELDFKNKYFGLSQTHLNFIELLTTRYEYPYSISFFIGEILTFVNPTSAQGLQKLHHEEDKDNESSTDFTSYNDNINKQSGSAIMGHVLTLGNAKLIRMDKKRNYWFQYSYKIKGVNTNQNSQKKWVFQIGYIYNQNRIFFDAIQFQIARDWTTRFDTSFLANLKLEYIFNIPVENANVRKGIEKLTSFQKIILGRNFHFKKIILGVDFGVKWELFKNNGDSVFSETSFILAPNLSW